MIDVDKLPKRSWYIITPIAAIIAFQILFGIISFLSIFLSDDMYQLWWNVHNMYVENMRCRLGASEARNNCIESFIKDLPDGSMMPGEDIMKCDDIWNKLLNDCEYNIDWEKIRELQKEG